MSVKDKQLEINMTFKFIPEIRLTSLEVSEILRSVFLLQRKFFSLSMNNLNNADQLPTENQYKNLNFVITTQILLYFLVV